jgi:ADP-heptose:LPS heptosyltransferase
MNVLLICSPNADHLLFVTPLIRGLRRAYSNVELHVLLPQGAREGLASHPAIHQIYEGTFLPEGLSSLIGKESFGLVIDLSQQSWPRGTIPEAVQTLTFRPGWIEKFFPSTRHLALRYLDLVKPLGIDDDGLGLDLFLPAGSAVQAQDLPTSHQLGYVLLAPADWGNLVLPPSLLNRFCLGLQHPILLIGSTAEGYKAGQWVGSLEGKVYSACGKFTAAETTDLIRGAKLVITGQFGWAQQAAAFQRPLLLLPGSPAQKPAQRPYYGARREQTNPEPYTLLKGRLKADQLLGMARERLAGKGS